jgi:thymidylate synthase (FAD)
VNKMKVELLSYTPNGEELVASAAKLCYSQSGIEDILEKQSKDSVESFIEKLMSIGHESPIEHISYTFGVEGVSRSLTHQLVRHRIASYSQQSQRYVKLDQFEYIVPPSIERNPEAKFKFIEAMAESQRKYDEIFEILYSENKLSFLNAGSSESDSHRMAEKKSIEDARYVFPNACETKIVLTMNARSLLNFFRHRCCNRAQWEIRAMAIEMLKLVKGVAPTLFKQAGPGCIGGPCPEGDMTCGKIAEVRDYFKKLQGEI